MATMRRGFTMIELIFVIVIIGILAAVALPKLAGIKDQAHMAKAGEYVQKMNEIIMPNLYSKAQIADVISNSGAIKNIPDANAPFTKLSDLIEVPKGFSNPTWSEFKTNLAAPTGASNVQPVMSNPTNHVNIFCRDGNETDMPRCWYSNKSTASESDFNVSKASF